MTISKKSFIQYPPFGGAPHPKRTTSAGSAPVTAVPIQALFGKK